jgi:hypothetical protein
MLAADLIKVRRGRIILFESRQVIKTVNSPAYTKPLVNHYGDSTWR